MDQPTWRERIARRLATEVNTVLKCAGLKLARHSPLIADMRPITRDPVEAFYRAEARPFLIDVDLDYCRNLHTAAFSCGTESRNPFIQTLLDYQTGRCHAYTDSPLYSFHKSWQPANAAEALGLDPNDAHPDLATSPPLGCVLPWMPYNPLEYASFWASIITADYKAHGYKLDASHGWKVWGPVSQEAGQAEFVRLIKAYGSIKRDGYRRRDNYDGDITGTLLSSGPEYRVMINTGQHRVAVLAALEYRAAPIRIALPHVRRSEVEAWPNVQKKLFSVEQALDIFDRIFSGHQPPLASALKDGFPGAVICIPSGST